MAEIFFLGILISMVKVSSMVDVEVGLSFWAYAMFNVFLIAALAQVDRFQLAQAIKRIVRDKQVSPQMPSSALHGLNLVSCHQCETVQAADRSRCSFCGHALHGRKRYSLQRAWSFLITALILYVPANVLPIMITYEMGNETFNTIAGGVVTLWEHGDYLICADYPGGQPAGAPGEVRRPDNLVPG